MMDRRARHVECSLPNYHARDEWARSQLEDAIGKDGSWPLFYGRHVADPPLYPRVEKKVWDVGTVAHACLTSPGGIDSVVAKIPDDVLNGQGYRKGKAWTEWSEAHAGLIQMRADELAPIRRMVHNVHAHPYGKWLMEHSLHFEFSLIYHCPVSGLACRARPDLLVGHRGKMLVVDFKTTRCVSPDDFKWDAWKFGYHRQFAWYKEAVELFGHEVAGCLALTVDKSPAHECRVYELPDCAVELGTEENHRNRTELARRLNEDDWTDPLGQKVWEVDLPLKAYEQGRLTV